MKVRCSLILSSTQVRKLESEGRENQRKKIILLVKIMIRISKKKNHDLVRILIKIIMRLIK
jgi:hypothetical protein